jgi:hypothetical protein
MGDPPLEIGGAYMMVTMRFPGVEETTCGASGTVMGVALKVHDSCPPPTELTARILILYSVPF